MPVGGATALQDSVDDNPLEGRLPRDSYFENLERLHGLVENVRAIYLRIGHRPNRQSAAANSSVTVVEVLKSASSSRSAATEMPGSTELTVAAVCSIQWR